EIIRFTYDERGNVIQAANPEVTVTYEYGAEGQLLREDIGGRVVEYKYDGCGSLVGMTYPSGETVTFDRDAELRLTSISEWEGGRHLCRHAADEGGFEHILPSGMVSTVRQTDTGQPLQVRVRRTSGDVRDSLKLEYSYDDEARLQALDDSEFGP